MISCQWWPINLRWRIERVNPFRTGMGKMSENPSTLPSGGPARGMPNFSPFAKNGPRGTLRMQFYCSVAKLVYFYYYLHPCPLIRDGGGGEIISRQRIWAIKRFGAFAESGKALDCEILIMINVLCKCKKGKIKCTLRNR